jgi:hypothetical protein
MIERIRPEQRQIEMYLIEERRSKLLKGHDSHT